HEVSLQLFTRLEAFEATSDAAAATVDVPAVTPIQERSGKRKRARPRKYALDGSLTQRPHESYLLLSYAGRVEAGFLGLAGNTYGCLHGIYRSRVYTTCYDSESWRGCLIKNHVVFATWFTSCLRLVSDWFNIQCHSSSVPHIWRNCYCRESAGQPSRTGGFSVLLSGPNGNILGGGVSGLLTTASLVQVVLGSFNVESQKASKMGNSSEPMSAPPRLVPGPSATFSPPSHGTFSEPSATTAILKA
ncbi:uncharacterized protein LOC120015085, partial [Tripterygium wilfordii]|uniref:uncharacterized protein LOC120015085 n=1 Tax=Tripterygium wilfordii TaxID=458696 RepID=UPI0018F82B9F